MKTKNIYVFGGGSIAHITNHFAVCAPAYGNTATEIRRIIECDKRFDNFNVFEETTKMTGNKQSKLETNEDIADQIEELKKDFNTKIIFFSCALVDFQPIRLEKFVGHPRENSLQSIGYYTPKFAKNENRMETRGVSAIDVRFEPTNKIISDIRTGRKDIFLVGFKTTCGATKQEMYEKGLRLCKEGSVNLVLVNDTKTRWNMIICPEEAVYGETQNRDDVLKELVDITWHRSQLTFTQSTVIAGEPVKWADSRIPDSLRKVVEHCIKGNAYKPFQGKTAGHFAVRLSETEFLTSIRKTNLNDLEKVGMVYIETDGPDTVLAYGAKPSVGGQSQRIVFKDHSGYDCICHFHSHFRENHPDNIPVASQREFSCGSHECGQNTSRNLKEFENGQIKAVMLDNHGPNIVFNRNVNPKLVIDFIERNFDLSSKTGGYNLIKE